MLLLLLLNCIFQSFSSVAMVSLMVRLFLQQAGRISEQLLEIVSCSIKVSTQVSLSYLPKASVSFLCLITSSFFFFVNYNNLSEKLNTRCKLKVNCSLFSNGQERER